MEVDAESFPYHLLGLFINISEADFVSFDFELSGIPSRLPGRKPRPGGGKFTLEERYAETKQGADRYQILQVGLTCARFDYTANQYVLRPYNINLSPLIEERLDIEREVSMQSGAITFLLGCGFDMAKPFTHGVQYLSREEAARAKQMAWDRLDKKNHFADLQLKEGDVDSLDFMRRVREAIANWKKTDSASLDITTHTGLKDRPSTQVISRFEKRLVHQLVRAEFPDLVSMGRSESIRLIYHDPEREASNVQRTKIRIKEQIARQTGFRWIFEALVGGSFHGDDPLHAARSMLNNSAEAHEIRRRYDKAVLQLRSRQPVLVGHNMFTDIVYFYRTFVGELPDTLQEFNNAIYELFPKIIDTKYLATHDGGDLNASPTLQEIAESLSAQPLPNIVTHQDHSKYQTIEAFHEAGYDSLLTATIMIRLAAKMGAEQEKTEKRQEPVSLPPVVRPKAASKATREKRQSNAKDPNAKDAADRRFQTKNIFDTLRELRLEEGDGADSSAEEEILSHSEDAGTCSTAGTELSTQGGWENEVFVQDKTGWVPLEQSQRHAMELIPAFDSSFWQEFGNTLRIFGTQEAVLRIADWEI